MEYRRRLLRDVWHFNPSCTEYPRAPRPGVIVIDVRPGRWHAGDAPKFGRVCKQCLAKARAETEQLRAYLQAHKKLNPARWPAA